MAKITDIIALIRKIPLDRISAFKNNIKFEDGENIDIVLAEFIVDVKNNIENILKAIALGADLFAVNDSLEVYDEIIEYLKEHNKINIPLNPKKNTLLHYFTTESNEVMIKKLLEYGAHFDLPNKQKYTALDMAFCWCNLQTLKLFQTIGKCDFHQDEKFKRPFLHLALINPDIEVFHSLIEEYGHAPQKAILKGEHGLLSSAACIGRLNIVKYLLENHELPPEDAIQAINTGLHSALISGHTETVLYLLDYLKQTFGEKAPLDKIYKDEHEGISLFDKCMEDYNQRILIFMLNNKLNPCEGMLQEILYEAIDHNDLEVICILLKYYHFSLRTQYFQDVDEPCPIPYAVDKLGDKGIDIIKCLIEKLRSELESEFNSQQDNAKKTINERLKTTLTQQIENETESNALHIACMDLNFDLIEFFLENDLFDIKLKNAAKCTPFHFAVLNLSKLEPDEYDSEKACRLVSLFLNSGANPLELGGKQQKSDDCIDLSIKFTRPDLFKLFAKKGYLYQLRRYGIQRKIHCFNESWEKTDNNSTDEVYKILIATQMYLRDQKKLRKKEKNSGNPTIDELLQQYFPESPTESTDKNLQAKPTTHKKSKRKKKKKRKALTATGAHTTTTHPNQRFIRKLNSLKKNIPFRCKIKHENTIEFLFNLIVKQSWGELSIDAKEYSEMLTNVFKSIGKLKTEITGNTLRLSCNKLGITNEEIDSKINALITHRLIKKTNTLSELHSKINAIELKFAAADKYSNRANNKLAEQASLMGQNNTAPKLQEKLIKTQNKMQANHTKNSDAIVHLKQQRDRLLSELKLKKSFTAEEASSYRKEANEMIKRLDKIINYYLKNFKTSENLFSEINKKLNKQRTKKPSPDFKLQESTHYTNLTKPRSKAHQEAKLAKRRHRKEERQRQRQRQQQQSFKEDNFSFFSSSRSANSSPSFDSDSSEKISENAYNPFNSGFPQHFPAFRLNSNAKETVTSEETSLAESTGGSSFGQSN